MGAITNLEIRARPERTGVLLADSQAVHLSEKLFDTLLLLIRNNGKLLTKDEVQSLMFSTIKKKDR